MPYTAMFFVLVAVVSVYTNANAVVRDSSRLLQRDASRSLVIDEDMSDADKLINHLDLKAHKLGGYASEFWRSNYKSIVAEPILAKVRDMGTSTYLLFKKKKKSVLYRFPQTQILYWHAGGDLKVYTGDSSGKFKTSFLGDPLVDSRNQFQMTIEPETWMAFECTRHNPFVLIGIAHYPGFLEEDIEYADPDVLVQQYPNDAALITSLSPET